MKKFVNGVMVCGGVDIGGIGGGVVEIGVDVDIRYLCLRDEGWCSFLCIGQVLIVLDIQVGDFQCIVFDEVVMWFDDIVYQGVEDLVGSDCIFDVYLQQVMGFWVYCGIL